MKTSEPSSSLLSRLDKACDYLPGVSTITNTVELVARSIFKNHHYSQDSSATSGNFSFIYKKDLVRCCIALVPVIGNIILVLSDLVGRFYKPVKPLPQLTEQEISERLRPYAAGLDKMIMKAQIYQMKLESLCTRMQQEGRAAVQQELDTMLNENPFIGLSNYTQFFAPKEQDPDYILHDSLARAPLLNENVIAIMHKLKTLMEIKIKICEQFGNVQINGPLSKKQFATEKANLETKGEILRSDSHWGEMQFSDIIAPVSVACVYIENNPD